MSGAQIHPTVASPSGVPVGEEAIIGRGVTIEGHTTIGDGCRVVGPPAATLERSILLRGACVGEGTYVEDCIVGPGYHVPSGEHIRGGVLVGAPQTETTCAA